MLSLKSLIFSIPPSGCGGVYPMTVAWLIRLWEIIVPNGLVVIVSTKGYGEEQLKPHLDRQ